MVCGNRESALLTINNAPRKRPDTAAGGRARAAPLSRSGSDASGFAESPSTSYRQFGSFARSFSAATRLTGPLALFLSRFQRTTIIPHRVPSTATSSGFSILTWRTFSVSSSVASYPAFAIARCKRLRSNGKVADMKAEQVVKK